VTHHRLNDLVAAERLHPPVPTPRQVHATWRRLQKSLAIGGVVVPFDVSAGSSAPLTTATTSSVTTAMGKLGGVFSGTIAKLTVATAVVGGTTTAVAVSQQEAIPSVHHSQERSTVNRPDRASAPTYTSAARELRLDVGTPSTEASVTPFPQLAVVVSPTEPSPTVSPQREPKRSTRGRTAGLSAPPPESAPIAGPEVSTPPPKVTQPEWMILNRAQLALRRGDPQSTLSWVDEHADLHPDGAFVEDREALRTLALCQLNPTDAAARSAFERFTAQWPSSMYERRLLSACRSS